MSILCIITVDTFGFNNQISWFIFENTMLDHTISFAKSNISLIELGVICVIMRHANAANLIRPILHFSQVSTQFIDLGC